MQHLRGIATSLVLELFPICSLVIQISNYFLPIHGAPWRAEPFLQKLKNCIIIYSKWSILPLHKCVWPKKNIVLVQAEQWRCLCHWLIIMNWWCKGSTITSYIQTSKLSGLCNPTSSHSHFLIIHAADAVNVFFFLLHFPSHYSLLWSKCLTEII